MKTSTKINISLEEVIRQLEQREAELDVINSVQEGIVSKMEMQKIYELVGDKIKDLFDAQVAVVSTFNLENQTEQFHYIFEDGERIYLEQRPIDKLRQRLIDSRELICINEDADEMWTKITGEVATALPGTQLTKSALYVPMVVGNTVRGYLSLQNLDRENAFSDSDIRLLSTLASSLSVALENARLLNESEQRNAELAVINSVQQGLVAEMDMQGIYDLVGDRIRQLFDSQVTGIDTYDHETGMEHFRYLYEDGKRLFPEPRPFDMVRKSIIKNGTLLLINEKVDDYLFKITGKKQKPVKGTQMPKSLLFVPLKVGDEVRGCVTLQNLEKENAFSNSDVSLLCTLANSMSVALENARLFNETEQRNAELAVINNVQQGLVAEMDIQGIYNMVGDRIRKLFDAQVTTIVTFDHKEKKEYFKYFFENGEHFSPKPRPFDKIREKIIKERKTQLWNENVAENFSQINGQPLIPVPGTLLPKSVLFVPMVVGDNVRGYLSLQNVDKEHAFTNSEVRLLTTLVNSMSVALENARLFNETTRLLAETEQRATELQTVNNISNALVSQLEFNALIKLIGEQMRITFNADIVYLALYDRKTNMISFPYIYGETAESRVFGNGITEKIILSKEPLLINQDMQKAYDKIEAERKGKSVESYLGVPIIAGKESIGVISVQSTEEENRFNKYDQRLLTTIAANVGIAMQNAEAYQKLQAALSDLKAAQEQLIQQEKLASLGQLTAGIAHEIKNPLNFVNNFSDLNVELIAEVFEEIKKLEKNGTVDVILDILQDINNNLKKIHQHGTRADGIVKSMLLHSRGGSGKMEPVDLNALIKEYVNLAFHGMRAGKNPINVGINLELDQNLGNALLIAEDFSRVILNLCNNAFDAMRDKSLLINNHDAYSPKIIIRTFRENGHINIEVEDNGPGIPEEYRDKILQPFFTTKKGTDGTGLGLSITNDIVKAHGGKISINSKEGSGTNIKIHLSGGKS